MILFRFQFLLLVATGSIQCAITSAFQINTAGVFSASSSSRTNALFMSSAAAAANMHNDTNTVSANDVAAAAAAAAEKKKKDTIQDEQQDDIDLKQKQTMMSSSKIKSSSSSTTTTTLDYPWTDMHEWILNDKITKYTIQIHDDNDNNIKCFILWRNLLNDTPELDGYPIPFLFNKLKDNSNNKNNKVWQKNQDLIILPYLDNYIFENSGGLSGYVYGVNGVADGTNIITTPVGDVQITIPKGYVRTGTVIYELGQPNEIIHNTNNNNKTPSLKNIQKFNKHWQLDGKELASNMIATASSNNRLQQQQNNDNIIDPELVQLGGLTAILIGGAWAIETLSHHLTVNVFWV